MKKLTVCLLISLLALISFSTMSYAASGSAIIPPYICKGTDIRTHLRVSNITDSIITVKVTLYDHSGVVMNNIGSNLNYDYIINLNTNTTNETFSFDLNSHSTGFFTVSGFNNIEMGYGRIEWFSEEDVIHGLVANGEMVKDSLGARALFQINQGQPF